MRTIGIPSRAMAAASSSEAPTVIPFSRAIWPACWITGPSASGSENGMPISSAAIPDVASFLPTSSDRFLVGWPAIMYATSLRSPVARSAWSSLEASESIFTGAPAKSRRSLGLRGAFDRIHVLVPAPRKADEDAPAWAELARDHACVVQRVRGLERRHDALEPGAELERLHRVLVADGHIVDTLRVAQERMLRTDPWIVQTRRDRVGVEDLAVAILQEV